MSKQLKLDKPEQKINIDNNPEEKLSQSDDKLVNDFKTVLNSFEQDYQTVTGYFQNVQKIIRRFENCDPYDIVLTSIPMDEKEELSSLADRISVRHGKLPVLIKQGQNKFFVYGKDLRPDLPQKAIWALQELDLEDEELKNAIPIPITLRETKAIRTTELAPELYEEIYSQNCHKAEVTGEAERKLEELEEYLTRGNQIFTKLGSLKIIAENNLDLKALIITAQNKTFAVYEKIANFLVNRGLAELFERPPYDTIGTLPAQGNTTVSGEIKSSAVNSNPVSGASLLGAGMYTHPSGKSGKRKLHNSQEEQAGSGNSDSPGPG